MTFSTDTLRPVSRLLASVPLAQPHDRLLEAACRWAAGTGRSVFSADQLRELQRVAASGHHPQLANLATDIELVFDALRALERPPSPAWEGYVQAWEQQIITDRLFTRGSYAQLRSLHEKLGGMLLPSRAKPFMLAIPQADGTWVQMGWETVLHLASCPITTPENEIHILREHYHDSSGPLPLHLAPDAG